MWYNQATVAGLWPLPVRFCGWLLCCAHKGYILVANLHPMDDMAPEMLPLPHLRTRRTIGFLGEVLFLFLLALNTGV